MSENKQDLTNFNRILSEAEKIALATSMDNIPEVRIVRAVYDAEQPGVMYISTSEKSPKALSFRENKYVAFTTLGDEYVRAKEAVVEQVTENTDRLKDYMSEKNPEYKTVFADHKNRLFFAIRFDTAMVKTAQDAEPQILYFNQDSGE